MTIRAEFGSSLPDVRLTGENIELRPFTHADLGVVEEASRDELIPRITTVPADYSESEGLAFIDRQHTRRTSGEGWSLAIATPDRSTAVGQIGLWIPHIHKGRVELGYWVVESGRGRHAAAKALALLSEWALANLDVDRLHLFVEPWNTASRRTAERAGFEQESLLRSWERVDGEAKDMWSYIRLRSIQDLENTDRSAPTGSASG
ncbi:MAG: GNAT family N-acetyltransferase [Acidimicrobiales bacterium]